MSPSAARTAIHTPDSILVCRSPGETRYALMAGEALVEIVHRRDGEVQPGAVYLGRVGARVPGASKPGASAVFVDFGDSSPGVLALKGRAPPEGAAVAVLVVVPARASKGAELKPAAVPAPGGAKAPSLLRAAPEPVVAWWRCYRDGIVRIGCAPRPEAARVKALLDADAPVEEEAAADPFAEHGVDDAITAALEATVALPCGGNLVIEATAAAVMIDVNSGPADPGTANAEAVVAIAGELRRRNITGHILIDVIPGARRSAWPRLLAEALSPDPVSAHVAGLTPLGMIELTRRREGLALAEVLGDGSGGLSTASIALKLLRDAVRFATSEKCAGVAVTAAPAVVALLRGAMRPSLAEAEHAVKGGISLAARDDLARERFVLGRA